MATFTSEAEILRMLGDDGYDAYLTDLSASDRSAFLDDVINYATSLIATSTQEYYYDGNISSDQMVRTNATIIACHLISERRGNASLWEGRMERIMEWLAGIKIGSIHLPGQEVMAPDVPVIRNYGVNFNSHNRILVDKDLSTGSYPNEPTYPDDTYYPYP